MHLDFENIPMKILKKVFFSDSYKNTNVKILWIQIKMFKLHSKFCGISTEQLEFWQPVFLNFLYGCDGCEIKTVYFQNQNSDMCKFLFPFFYIKRAYT